MEVAKHSLALVSETAKKSNEIFSETASKSRRHFYGAAGIGSGQWLTSTIWWARMHR